MLLVGFGIWTDIFINLLKSIIQLIPHYAPFPISTQYTSVTETTQTKLQISFAWLKPITPYNKTQKLATSRDVGLLDFDPGSGQSGIRPFFGKSGQIRFRLFTTSS